MRRTVDPDDDLRTILESVPGWHDAITDVAVLPGGITNRSLRVTTLHGSYVVRVPGAQTEMLGINRRAEAAITNVAACLGIAPTTLCELPSYGTVISEFVDARTATADDLRDPEVLAGVLAVIRTLHECDPVPFRFPVFDIVRQHVADARSHGREHDAIDQVMSAVQRIEAVIAPDSLTATLCHNDLLPANVLLGASGRVWLIDYEYAGMNHQMFDLANLSVNAGFDPSLDEVVLRAMIGDITDGGLAELGLMKIVSEAREGMWALVQSAISAVQTIDYNAYADDRLRNCVRLCSDQSFDEMIRRVAV